MLWATGPLSRNAIKSAEAEELFGEMSTFKHANVNKGLERVHLRCAQVYIDFVVNIVYCLGDCK